MMQRPKIYFAGSIRGGRSGQELYRKLIGYLSHFGDVLTEHVGDGGLTASGEDEMSDSEIYSRDLEWIRSADLVVAEVTIPSLGVGYEIGKAEQLKKPILCLHERQTDRRLSAMVAGNKGLLIQEYTGLSEAERHLNDFLTSLGIQRTGRH
jgi:nucleoside 2-deoxyribosyltransferase